MSEIRRRLAGMAVTGRDWAEALGIITRARVKLERALERLREAEREIVDGESDEVIMPIVEKARGSADLAVGLLGRLLGRS